MTSLENRMEAEDELRTAILAGSHDLAIQGLNGEHAPVTALVSMRAAVLYEWDDPEMLEAVARWEGCDRRILANLYHLGACAIAAKHILTGIPYAGDDPDVIEQIERRIACYEKNQVIG